MLMAYDEDNRQVALEAGKKAMAGEGGAGWGWLAVRSAIIETSVVKEMVGWLHLRPFFSSTPEELQEFAYQVGNKTADKTVENPFNWSKYNVTADPSVHLSYSVALHDAIMLYAHAATKVLSVEGDLSDSQKVTAAIRSTNFTGAGGTVILNSIGDRDDSWEFMNYVVSYSAEKERPRPEPVGLFDRDLKTYEPYERAVVWPGNTKSTPLDYIESRNESFAEQIGQHTVLSIVVGTVTLLAMGLLLYGINKHRRALKAFLRSFLNQEGKLVFDGATELIDIIGDIYSTLHMYQFSRNCGYRELWAAFMVCLFPAVLSSLIAMFFRIRAFSQKVQDRARDREQNASNMRELFGHTFETRRPTFRQMVEFYKLVQDRRDLLERQSIGALERQRMYLHVLVALAEDLPFCVLNMMLVLVPRRDKLICKETAPSKAITI